MGLETATLGGCTAYLKSGVTFLSLRWRPRSPGAARARPRERAVRSSGARARASRIRGARPRPRAPRTPRAIRRNSRAHQPALARARTARAKRVRRKRRPRTWRARARRPPARGFARNTCGSMAACIKRERPLLSVPPSSRPSPIRPPIRLLGGSTMIAIVEAIAPLIFMGLFTRIISHVLPPFRDST